MAAVSPYAMAAAGSHNGLFAEKIEYTEAITIETSSDHIGLNKALGPATSVTLTGSDDFATDQGFAIETAGINSYLRFEKSFDVNNSHLLVSGSDYYGAHLIGSFSSNSHT